jgi:integrase
LHKASGQAVVDIAGKTYYLGEHNSKQSKTKYSRLIAEYFASPEAFTVSKSDPTIAELLLAYAKHCQTFYGKAPTSEWWRVKPVLKACKDLYADIRVDEFGPLQFRAVRQNLLDGLHVPKEKRRRLSRRYVNALMDRLRRCFRWGVSESIVPVAVYQALKAVEGLKAGKEPKVVDLPQREGVSDSVVEKTLPHLPPMLADVVRLQRLLGCRPSEILSVRAGMVIKSTDVWEIPLVQHKNASKGKSRVLYCGPKAQAILAKYIDGCGDNELLFSPKRSEYLRRTAKRKTSLSCGNRPGKSNTPRKTRRTLRDSYSPGAYANAVRRACLKAGVERWSPYRLRHAKAAELQEQSDIESVKVTLGHSQIKMSEHYAKQDRKRAREAARKFG